MELPPSFPPSLFLSSLHPTLFPPLVILLFPRHLLYLALHCTYITLPSLALSLPSSLSPSVPLSLPPYLAYSLSPYVPYPRLLFLPVPPVLPTSPFLSLLCLFPYFPSLALPYYTLRTLILNIAWSRRVPEYQPAFSTLSNSGSDQSTNVCLRSRWKKRRNFPAERTLSIALVTN